MVIPDATKTIGNYAFYVCKVLETITIGDGVEQIGDAAFANCPLLTEYYGKFASDDHKTLSNAGILMSVASDFLTYTIPDGIVEIAPYAFTNCTNLTEINFSGSVTKICNNAFSQCHTLAEVKVGEGVETIVEGAFSACSAITKFSGRYASEDGLRLEKDGVLLRVATGNISSYEIPETITEIGEAAFNGAEDLTSVIIPNTVTSIANSAFADCKNLIDITIPDSVKMLRSSIFWRCSELTTITIGRGITMIFYGTFAYCPKLATIYCRAINPPLFNHDGAFDGSTAISKIYVPTESVDLYKSADGWSRFADMIEGYSI